MEKTLKKKTAILCYTKAANELAEKIRQNEEELGLECRTIGEGLLVTEQTPPPGTAVPKGGTVVLTLGGEEESVSDADRAAFLSVENMVNEKMEVRP